MNRLYVVSKIWGHESEKDLIAHWIDRTVFYLLRPKPDPEIMWGCDKQIEVQKTSRPPYSDIKVWSHHNSKQMRREISAEWEAILPSLDRLESKQAYPRPLMRLMKILLRLSRKPEINVK